MKSLNLIACISRSLGLGYQGDLLFHIPADLEFFRTTTLGSPVVMGGKTFRSIGHALPGRENIVLSRSPIPGESITSFSDLAELKSYLKTLDSDIYIIGGASLYSAFLPDADYLYLTRVDAEPPADAFFPEFDVKDFSAKILQDQPASDDNPAYQIIKYSRL